jgi:rhodanese-related sulfurtransferase
MKTTYLFAFILLFSAAILSCGKKGESGEQESAETTQADTTGQASLDAKVKKINAMQLSKMIEAGVELNIIDVRSPDEIEDGKIPGALEMEFESDDFDEKIEPLEREKTYILYCAAGGRSQKAAKRMLQKGFRSVYNLEGGYDAWVAETSR